MSEEHDQPGSDDLPPKGKSGANSASFSGRVQLLANHPWVAFVLPLAIFMAVGCFEPKPPTGDAANATSWELPYSAYPWVYTLKVALTSAALVWVWPAVAALPRRVTPWSIIVGVVGVVLWVGLWKLQLEKKLLEPLGLGKLLDFGVRSAYNPLVELKSQPALAYAFLAVRLFGLAVVIAMAEELFLRAFLMRFVIRHDWWTVPFGDVTRLAVPMLMHPAELLAAGVWFSLVTWLMMKTRSLGDCILAHATTNLLLGCYVLYSGEWTLL
jgi:CAAX prenyl protease-like protein